MASTTDYGFIGTEFKFAVSITAPGFDMTEDDFTVEIRRGSKSRVFTKEELVVDENDKYYVCFDSAEFGKGQIVAIIRAYVPDDDFDDGFRTEVYKMNLIYVEGL